MFDLRNGSYGREIEKKSKKSRLVGQVIERGGRAGKDA
jgi:hypothetical protein